MSHASASSGVPHLEPLEPRLLLSAVAAPHVAAVVLPPTVTGITGKYDGNPDPAVVGRYIAGVSVIETLGAKVTASSWADPVTLVTFKLGNQTFVDTVPWDGWGFSFDVGTLSATTSLVVTAQSRSGQTSNAYQGQVQIIPKPEWISEMGGTVTFSTTSRVYVFHARQEVLQQSVTIPVDCPILAGKYASADLGLTIDATVPTAPAGAIRSTLTGSLLVYMLGKQQVSKTWIAPTALNPTAAFNGSLLLDPTTLEIDSLAASFNYNGTTLVNGSLAKCPVAAFLGVTGNLTMNTAVAVGAACHYQSGTGLVVDDGSTLNANTNATLSNGTLNTVRTSNVPIVIQWGLSGTVQGTITQGLSATCDTSGPQWGAPLTAHIQAQLSGNSAITQYLQNILGWDTTKPVLLDISTDLLAM